MSLTFCIVGFTVSTVSVLAPFLSVVLSDLSFAVILSVYTPSSSPETFHSHELSSSTARVPSLYAVVSPSLNSSAVTDLRFVSLAVPVNDVILVFMYGEIDPIVTTGGFASLRIVCVFVSAARL